MDPMQFFNSPPSFQPSAASGAGPATSGSIGSSFQSGDFTVGGMKTNWYIILGGVVVLYFLYKKMK